MQNYAFFIGNCFKSIWSLSCTFALGNIFLLITYNFNWIYYTFYHDRITFLNITWSNNKDNILNPFFKSLTPIGVLAPLTFCQIVNNYWLFFNQHYRLNALISWSVYKTLHFYWTHLHFCKKPPQGLYLSHIRVRPIIGYTNITDTNNRNRYRYDLII